jgi:hypothetical protein
MSAISGPIRRFIPPIASSAYSMTALPQLRLILTLSIEAGLGFLRRIVDPYG